MAVTVGLLYPGIGADDDFTWLAESHPDALALPLVHTAGGDVAHTVDELLAVGGDDNLADGVDELMRMDAALDSVVWACTSGSFVYGRDGARAQADGISSRAGVPASSTSLAFTEACRALGLTRVAVAASYPADLAEHFRRFLLDAGIEVVSFLSNDIATAGEVGLLGRDEVTRLVLAADVPEAEAILVPDTAMHSLRWLEHLEAAAGKTVLTANQVTVWEGMRLAGVRPELPGLGTLFAPRGRS